MGISTKKSSSKVTPVYDKQLLGAHDTLSNTYKAQAPRIDGIANGLTDLLPEMQQRWRDGNPALNAATGYVTDTLGTDTVNPQLDAMVASSNQDVQNRLGAKLARMGIGPGGTTYQTRQADALSKNELGLRYGAWNDLQTRKANAAGMAPGIAAGEAVGVVPMLSTAELGANLPMDAAYKYAQGTGGLLGQYTNQANRDSPSTASQIGKGLKVASNLFSMFSDARLKTDVRRVGQTDEGLTLYSFRYGGDGPFHIGPMAQEVRETQPDALGPEVAGYLTVHYERVR